MFNVKMKLMPLSQFHFTIFMSSTGFSLSFPWHHGTVLFSKLGLEEGRGIILLRVRNERIGYLVKEMRLEQTSALQSNLSLAENLLRRKQGNIKG